MYKFSLFSLLKIGDIIIIAFILISALVSFLYFNRDKSYVVIHHDNNVLTTINLNNDTSIDVTEISDFNTILASVEVKDKKARITYSTCKDQLCVKQSWSNNQPIICVPNKILLEFSVGETEKNDRMFITR